LILLKTELIEEFTKFGNLNSIDLFECDLKRVSLTQKLPNLETLFTIEARKKDKDLLALHINTVTVPIGICGNVLKFERPAFIQ
jgi:hypothetical protein